MRLKYSCMLNSHKYVQNTNHEVNINSYTTDVSEVHSWFTTDDDEICQFISNNKLTWKEKKRKLVIIVNVIIVNYCKHLVKLTHTLYRLSQKVEAPLTVYIYQR